MCLSRASTSLKRANSHGFLPGAIWSITLLLLLSGCASNPFERFRKTPDIQADTNSAETPATARTADNTSGDRSDFVWPEEGTRSTARVSKKPAKTAQESAPQPVNYANVWNELRAGFSLPEVNHRYVDAYEKYLRANPGYVHRLVQRATPFLPHILQQVKARNMPLEIALLPAIESAFKVNAYSRAGASGLWQFMRPTGKQYGLHENDWYDGRRDVLRSTGAALDYLQVLNKQFKGDWLYTITAYNSGGNGLKRAIRRNRRANLSPEISKLKLRPETLRYVPKLIAYRNLVRSPERFGISLTPIENKPHFEVVDMGFQTSLATIASKTPVTLKHLKALNPALKRLVTPPTGPHPVLVPAALKQNVVAALNSLPKEERVKWAQYRVRKGDVLGAIAHRYSVSVKSIRSANKLKSNLIRVGQVLILPILGTPSTTVASASTPTSTASTKKTITHKVGSGDTLWGIAKYYRVDLKNLMNWNQLKPNDMLQPGQDLLVLR